MDSPFRYVPVTTARIFTTVAFCHTRLRCHVTFYVLPPAVTTTTTAHHHVLPHVAVATVGYAVYHVLRWLVIYIWLRYVALPRYHHGLPLPRLRYHGWLRSFVYVTRYTTRLVADFAPHTFGYHLYTVLRLRLHTLPLRLRCYGFCAVTTHARTAPRVGCSCHRVTLPFADYVILRFGYVPVRWLVGCRLFCTTHRFFGWLRCGWLVTFCILPHLRFLLPRFGYVLPHAPRSFAYVAFYRLRWLRLRFCVAGCCTCSCRFGYVCTVYVRYTLRFAFTFCHTAHTVTILFTVAFYTRCVGCVDFPFTFAVVTLRYVAFCHTPRLHVYGSLRLRCPFTLRFYVTTVTLRLHVAVHVAVVGYGYHVAGCPVTITLPLPTLPPGYVAVRCYGYYVYGYGWLPRSLHLPRYDSRLPAFTTRCVPR